MFSTQVVIGDILPYTQSPATSQGQTVFGTNWTANASSDVVVYYTPLGSSPNDVAQILAYPANYSVSFIGSQQQVQVTLVTGAVNIGDIVTITRQTPADRENLYTNTNFTPSMLNNDFGILTLVDQQAQLVNQLIGPRYNYSAVITDVVDTILPILGANQTWAKNGSNTAIVPITITPGGGINGTINIGGPNQVAYYAGSGNTINGLPQVNPVAGQVLISGSSAAPSWSQTPTLTSILDTNGNTGFGITTTASAVNYVNVTNNSTTNAPIISALGSDTNITLQLKGQGTGGIAIQGTGTNDSASVGYIGEYVTSNIPSASAVSISNNTPTNVTSISLTKGDWNIFGNVFFIGTSVTNPQFLCWTSLISATVPDSSLVSQVTYVVTGLAIAAGLVCPFLRVSIESTTTVYLSAKTVVGAGSVTGCGSIFARRVR